MNIRTKRMQIENISNINSGPTRVKNALRTTQIQFSLFSDRTMNMKT